MGIGLRSSGADNLTNGGEQLKILLTGGTGYLGSNLARALADAGEEVELLVRSRHRAEDLGFGDLGLVEGDVVERERVAAALEGKDAVVHAASVYSFDHRRAAEMERVNVTGTRTVLGEAVRLGLDPIIHVSSTVAFLPGTGSATPDSPPGDPTGPYAASKAESERVARAMQAEGAPVVCVSPGGIYGGVDPNFGEQYRFVLDVLKRRLPVMPRGGFHAVDVADAVATVLAVLEPGRGPRRYIVPGHHVGPVDVARGVAAVTGRRLPAMAVPTPMLKPAGRFADLVQARVPVRLPVSAEALYVTECDLDYDDSRAREELGIDPRPLEDSLAEMVAQLLTDGKITNRQAGRLG
jgi:nucleoside-diphosphate-sugar epimerase